MSKRNLILFIIILVILAAVVLGFLYFRQPKGGEEGDTGGINFLSEFNPFGRKKEATPAPAIPIDISETPSPGAEAPEIKLKRVSSMPVAGFAVFQKERFKDVSIPIPITAEGGTPPGAVAPPPTEFAPALRYVARATGNIYQTFADKIDERRFSVTLVPKVSEAFFGKGAESVVMRYLKTDDRTIATFAGSVPKENLGADSSGNNEIRGTFLPDGISDMSVAPDGLKIFYLLNVLDNAVGVTAGVLGDKKLQVFDSPFTEWTTWWPNNKMITLTTKPSAGVPGYLYAIDPGKKDLNKILGDINGLTTLTSPSGKLVLWSNNNLSLGIYDIDTKTTNFFGARTLPEKCVWGKASDVIFCAVPKFVSPSLYPDAWYKGEISFSDEIWKIDVKNQNATMISDLSSINGIEDMDNIKLALDENANYLFFVNKKDSYLWELSLK
ncbi:MAG: hypothetical protein AAB815_01065 [Patescibacteria group bacterium]